jgi:hypothetical protein
MAKRYREFKRINLKAKTARYVRESLVDKTFNDHYKKCADDPDCCHNESRSLHVARLVEANITVGKKRAYLDVPCPWFQSNPVDHVNLLETLVSRLRAFAEVAKNHGTRDACLRAANEIDDYAHRNAMEVLAETVVDVDRT